MSREPPTLTVGTAGADHSCENQGAMAAGFTRDDQVKGKEELPDMKYSSTLSGFLLALSLTPCFADDLKNNYEVYEPRKPDPISALGIGLGRALVKRFFFIVRFPFV